MSHIKKFTTSWLIPIFLGLLIAILLKTFVLQFNDVSGDSMIPTFQDKDYLLSEKVSYRLDKPQRNDIVIVKTPDKLLIKRVIGVEGDTIEFIPTEDKSKTILFLNGESLQEDYIYEPMEGIDYKKITVEKNKVFVMGDNRNNSMDSRAYGAFDIKDINSKVILELRDNFKRY